MFKKIIFLALFTLLTSGCVERGQNIKPKTILVVDHTEKKLYPRDRESSYVLHLNAEDKTFDTLKNSISGSLIVIIGLIIFL